MKRKIGVVCMILGFVLILAALALLLYNLKEAEAAGKAAEDILSDIQTAVAEQVGINDLQEKTAQESFETESSCQEELPISDETEYTTEMPMVEIDGYTFIGYLSLPDLNLELPVMSEWDYDRLKIAPCRQFGSINGNDMVIAAHNYKQHFGRLKDLEIGECVLFTDMDGNVTTYLVQNSEILQPTDVADVENSVYDLVLYTCTYGGNERVVVGCDKK